MTDIDQFLARWNERNERLRAANDANREAIFDALVAIGAERIEITFDGYGDSGQIDNVAVTGRSETLTGEMTVMCAPWTGPNEAHTCKLDEAVEAHCYALLEQEHTGWQDNDGAYGTFVFDVAARTVTLECHTRFTDVNTSIHNFGEA
jgi:hypothetical protein